MRYFGWTLYAHPHPPRPKAFVGGSCSQQLRRCAFVALQVKAIWDEYEVDSDTLRAVLVSERDRQRHKLQVRSGWVTGYGLPNVLGRNFSFKRFTVVFWDDR